MGIRSTRFRFLLALPLLVVADGLLPRTVRAETRTAAALTPEAVWEAINAAKDGDIVQLPEGTAVWKKGWNANHWAKMKAITIQGAGIDKTIIRTDTTTAPGDKSFVINGVEGKPFRITGITFDGTGFPTAGTWAGEVVISGNCKNFRVDHCKFLGICDGTNPIDGNEIPAGQRGAGHPAFGQPGRATDADGDGVFEPSPCYAWNNTLNGAQLNMVLRPWANPEHAAKQAEHVKEGRDFFNEAPPAPLLPAVHISPSASSFTMKTSWRKRLARSWPRVSSQFEVNM
ncbi:MAG: hypothetical protein NTY19_50185 [Planctomycetota bacterium]|nr:hypothetical protein [Planctomycetota bacterium]